MRGGQQIDGGILRDASQLRQQRFFLQRSCNNYVLRTASKKDINAISLQKERPIKTCG
jgi:hypothetical protein